MAMKKVCVITGGGSGMGLAAAKFMSNEKIIVLSGRTVSKLENAVEELKELGLTAYPFACDTSDRLSVRKLAEYAASLGQITNVINAAGLSPAMADPQKLLRVNALGTVYVNQEFSKLMDGKSVIVDISSNSAYVLPKFLISEKTYALAEINEGAFLEKCIKKSNLARTDYEKAGFAYALSKNFVVWYAKKSAKEYGAKGIRVCSLSPGLIDTDMGRLEEKEGSSMLQYGAEKRMGKPEELGYAIATVADERNGYLAGVDILCDGGCTTLKKF
jgi:NAD(P)-dependent dehydrogenase (short-subunit alcohol dehydrogenase family)